MIKVSLTEMTVSKRPRDIKKEEWDLMPVGTTFIHFGTTYGYDDEGHLCVKINDEFLFDFEEQDSFSVKTNHSLIVDAHGDPIKFELVDVSITAKEK